MRLLVAELGWGWDAQVFEKFIEHAKELSALIVPGSLLVGVSWLTGTCWALALNAFGFISVADVVRSALLASQLWW